MNPKQLAEIFAKSGRKNKRQEKQVINIDYHEKNSLIASELIHLGSIIEFQHLKVADYIINNIAIERKTVSDFISSMLNRRLIRQLEELQQYPNRLLIIEGIEEQDIYTENNAEAGIHPNAVRGFILSILLKHKTPILFTKNYQDTARFLELLAKKKSIEQNINPKKKAWTPKEQLQFIIEGFPGIGPKSAKKLLGHFHNIKNIVNANEEELKEILGESKAKVIKKLIEEDYK
jgi:Fanconi anemia group M protein